MNKQNLLRFSLAGMRIMVATLVLMVLAIGSASLAYAEEVNLALGKECTVEGGSLTSGQPPMMVDGNITTMWRTNKGGSPKIHTGKATCDLAGIYTINRVVVTEYKQKAVNITVRISTDGTNWIDVASQDFQAIGSDNRRSEFKFNPQSARWVQVEAKDAVYAFGIYELEIYGTR